MNQSKTVYQCLFELGQLARQCGHSLAHAQRGCVEQHEREWIAEGYRATSVVPT